MVLRKSARGPSPMQDVGCEGSVHMQRTTTGSDERPLFRLPPVRNIVAVLRESHLSMAGTVVVSCRELQGRKMADVLGALEEAFCSARCV